MKKAIQVNIHDRIFYIDEDAYELLQKYLHRLSLAFPDEEGQEIVSDIEIRVAELFEERIVLGYNVINIDYVNKVIDTVGQPEDLQDGETVIIEEETAEESNATPPPFTEAPPKHEKTEVKKKLFRDVNNKVFGGVLSGLGIYLDWNINVMRVLAIVIALCTQIWPCIVVYLIAWMVIPPADTPRRRLEMLGKPVTVDNIGQDLRKDPDQKSSGQEFVSIAAKIIMGIIGIVALFFCGGWAIGLIFSIFFLIGFAIFGVGGLGALMAIPVGAASVLQCTWSMLMCICGLVLFGAICWLSGTVIFNWRSAQKGTLIGAGIIFIIALAASLIILFQLISNGFAPIPFVD
ncbi:MAG: PspC domain-containing protein [Bacteroidales bacterium]|nr:PspC domain-containing protein [Bacteroidales bacterium]